MLGLITVIILALGWTIEEILRKRQIDKLKRAHKWEKLEINEAWREYERKTVKLFELRGKADSLIRMIRVMDEVWTEADYEKLPVDFNFIIIKTTHEFSKLLIDIGAENYLPPDEGAQTVQWLCNVKAEVTRQIQAIYDEHNKGGLLQRRER